MIRSAYTLFFLALVLSYYIIQNMCWSYVYIQIKKSKYICITNIILEINKLYHYTNFSYDNILIQILSSNEIIHGCEHLVIVQSIN